VTPDQDPLAQLEAAAREATPGPWYAECCHVGPSCWCRTVGNKAGSDDLNHCVVTAGGIGTKDAEYIALANPQTILALIGRLRKAEAVVEAVRRMDCTDMNPRTVEPVQDAIEAYDQEIGQ